MASPKWQVTRLYADTQAKSTRMCAGITGPRRISRRLPVGLLVACGVACEQPHSVSEQEPRPAPKEIFGHRFEVLADVNGDGKSDTVREVYWSQALGREAAKFLADVPYDTLVWRAAELNPAVFLRWGGGPEFALPTSAGFGLALLVNEGDLDGDGADELGYVPDNADWSNTTTYHVIGLRGGRWRELFAFPIWEWQLHDLPGNTREYGLVGQMGRTIDTASTSAATVDLVLPIGPGKARVVGNTGEADLDSMDVLFKEGDTVRSIVPELGPP